MTEVAMSKRDVESELLQVKREFESGTEDLEQALAHLGLDLESFWGLADGVREEPTPQPSPMAPARPSPFGIRA
jgi:hypothetical protein